MASLLGNDKTSGVFRCPQCKEYISASSQQCKFCGTAISADSMNAGVEQERLETKRENRNAALKHLGIGALIFLVGLGITVWSFSEASEGGRFRLMYGLMIVGGLDFLYGAYLFASAMKD